MKIRGGSGECVAPLAEWTLADLPAGLTVFHGANETGKSLLARLLGGILCGFPPGAWETASGRRIGGRLGLVCSDGEYTVERWWGASDEARITRPDGRSGSTEDLARLLGGGDGERLRALCTLRLADVGSLSLAHDGELGAAVLNPALAAARRAAARAFAGIDAESARLFSGHGGGRIDVAVAELNRLRPRLDAVRRAAAGYDQLRSAAERAGEELERLRTELRARRVERERLRRWIDLWPAWQALETARGELAELEAHPSDDPERLLDQESELPSRGGARRAALAAELDEVRGKLRALEEERDRARFSRDALQASLPDLIERWEDEVTRNATREARAGQGDRQAAGGSVATLAASPAAVDASSAVAGGHLADLRFDEVRGWERRLRAARSEERAAEGALAVAVRQRDELRRRLTEVSGVAPVRDLRLAQGAPMGVAGEVNSPAPIPVPSPVESAVLARRRHALARVRAALAASESERTTAEALRQQVAEGERMVRILEAEGDPDLPPWLVLAIVVAILGSVFVLLEVGAAEDSWTILIVLVMAVLAAFNGIYELRQWVAKRKRARKKLMQSLRAELRRAGQGSEEQGSGPPRWCEAVSAECAELGLPSEPTVEDLAVCEANLTAQEMERSRREAAELHVEELSKALAVAEDRIRGLADDLSSARKRLGTANAEWTAWRAAVGFAGDLTPEQVHALLAYGNGATNGESRAAPSPVVESRAGVGRENGAAMVERFVASLRDGLAGQSSRWQETIAAREEGIRVLRRREEELGRMLGEAGAEDESELERRRRIVGRRSELVRIVAEREQEIDFRLGEEAAREEGRRELGRGRPDQWAESERSVEAEIEKTETALDRARAEAEAARQACRALEGSVELAGLEIEWSGWMAELTAAVDRWRLLAVARGLVEDSLQSLEHAGEPPVLVAASRTLSTATAGRYERIAQDDGGQALVLIDRDGRRRRVPEELSQSTLEQVCLCLRLAVADELTGGNETLPLVIDDVLANCDPERARAMARVFREIAAGRQVLYFTCHPETRDLLREVAGASRVVEL